MKYDSGKDRINLVPPDVIRAVSKVFAFGADKYGENNWRDDMVNTSYVRTYNSIQRHLLDWLEGIDNDPESGFPHLDHALTQLMILKMQTLYSPSEMDDRYKGPNKNETA